jgi:hypothetical protein
MCNRPSIAPSVQAPDGRQHGATASYQDGQWQLTAADARSERAEPRLLRCMETAASYRSGTSLLRQVEQMPSAIESTPFQLVRTATPECPTWAILGCRLRGEEAQLLHATGGDLSKSTAGVSLGRGEAELTAHPLVRSSDVVVTQQPRIRRTGFRARLAVLFVWHARCYGGVDLGQLAPGVGARKGV